MQHAEIMFGELVIAFGHHVIARRMRIASELHVFFGNGLRRATHLYVRPVAFIDPVDGVAAATMLAAATAGSPIVATAVTLVVVILALTMRIIKIQDITTAVPSRSVAKMKIIDC